MSSILIYNSNFGMINMMQETYKIIHDINKLQEYINWLPDLNESEMFYGCLFARKKYCSSVPWPGGDKTQLRRFTIITN